MAILVVEQYLEWARDIADDYAVILSGTRETMNESEVRRKLMV
jgi:urea transport system ATP-binding protein